MPHVRPAPMEPTLSVESSTAQQESSTKRSVKISPSAAAVVADERLMAALGLSPAFGSRGSMSPFEAGGFSDPVLASAAPYALPADSPALHPVKAMPSPVQRQSSRDRPKPRRFDSLNEQDNFTLGDSATASGGRSVHSSSTALNPPPGFGTGLTSPEWGWYVSLSPPSNLPGTRTIISSVAGLPSGTATPPNVGRSDSLDLYVTGMGKLPATTPSTKQAE
jgi:hypothetical protein